MLKEGIVLFNTSPKKGISFIIKNNAIDEGAESIAKFMMENYGKLINIEVMHKYIDLFHQYASMTIDEALRHLLKQFKLPGEA